MMKIFALAVLFIGAGLWAQEPGGGFSVRGLVEWDRMEMNASCSLDLGKAGIKLPSGRSRAEALLENEYSGLIRPFILLLQADSSSTIGDLVDRGELSLRDADRLSTGALRIPPSLSGDLKSMSARYTFNLSGITRQLIRHTRPQNIQSPLVPIPADSYTGIIIIADETLPVHGRNISTLVLPCLFPKVWDSGMNLVYERNMTDPDWERRKDQPGIVRYATRDAITRPSPSGLDESLLPLVGQNPLRIMARAVFGAVPTDPVIDRDDAMIILSNESNRTLLKEGRVVLVLDKETLKTTIGN